MKSSVDIMMLTYGRWAYTEQTIASVLANTTDWPYRLIVVDNGSVDDTRANLTDFVDRGIVHTLYLEKANTGNAGGKNLNLQRAKSEYVCLLDNDMLLLPGWLAKCMDAMLHFKKQKLHLMSPWPIWKFAPNTVIGHLKDDTHDVILTRKLSGQVWIGHRKALLKCGGFKQPKDGRYMGFFASPLSKKLVKQGYKIGCVANEELAISLDRAGSPYRINTEDAVLYREWNKRQKNGHEVLPDFHVWRKDRGKKG